MGRRSTEHKQLEALLSQVVFSPTPEQRKVKASFWAVFGSEGLGDEEVSLSAILAVTNDTRMREWWYLDGFQNWFLNKEEHRQRVEYLSFLALDAIENVFLQGTSDTAKIAAAKLLFEAASKMPRKGTAQYADDAINKMTEAQLKEYLKRTAPQLIQSLGGSDEQPPKEEDDSLPQ